MDNLSRKFRERFIPDFRKMPKGVTYSLLGIRYDKLSKVFLIPEYKQVPSMDRIFDPFANDGNGGYVDIYYTSRQRPTGPNSQKEFHLILGDIGFTRMGRGMMQFGGNKRDIRGAGLALCEYLWVCNYNKDNKGKPWHVEPNNYLFATVSSGKKIEDALAKEELILKAKNTIGQMSLEDIKQTAVALMPSGMVNSIEEGRLYLMQLAGTDPDRLLSSLNDASTKMRALIRSGEQAGAIHYDINNLTWRFSKTNEVIVHKVPGKSSLDSLADFLTTKDARGHVVTIEDMISAHKTRSAGDRVDKYEVNSEDVFEQRLAEMQNTSDKNIELEEEELDAKVEKTVKKGKPQKKSALDKLDVEPAKTN